MDEAVLDPRSVPVLGIIGYGAFGQLMARCLAPYVRLILFDTHRDVSESDPASPNAVTIHRDFLLIGECDLICLATPVSAFAGVIHTITPWLRPGQVVLDVGSVKMAPVQQMRDLLPDFVEILGTHPLFGPQSAAAGLDGLKIALCPVRGDEWRRIAAFLRKTLRLRVYITSPERHDRDAAMVQGLTHLIAKVLVEMEPLPRQLTTRSFDMLMQAINMVRDDAPEVFDAIERTNPFSHDVRHRFFDIANALTRKLNHPSWD